MSALKGVYAGFSIMAKGSTVAKSERQRRAAQSARDKSAARGKRSAGANNSKRAKSDSNKNARGSSRGSLSKVASSKAGVQPYTKLILDPCHAKLTPTPLPGRDGSSLFRLPFRQVITVPSSTANIQGGGWVAGGSGTPSAMTSLNVSLVPHAMGTGAGGNFALAVIATSAESSGSPTAAQLTANSNYLLNNTAFFFDPVGLSSLNSIESMMRPVAGCVKLEFYSGSANTGSFFGWEGPCGQYFTQGTTGLVQYLPNVTNSTFAMTGWSSGIVTEGVEAAVNIAASTPQWQEFRSAAGIGGTNAGYSGSFDATDADYSQLPMAAVGVGGATPGTSYLVSGAIVYEWVPSINLGPGGNGVGMPSQRKSSLLAKVIEQVSEYGPMLVGVASKLVTGGPSLALSDLFYRMAINNNNIQGTPARTQIGWH